jgi:hypothetical protein
MAVTTPTAHNSRITSTTLPTPVSGFFIDEETLSTCTVAKKREPPKPWMSLQAIDGWREPLVDDGTVVALCAAWHPEVAECGLLVSAGG